MDTKREVAPSPWRTIFVREVGRQGLMLRMNLIVLFSSLDGEVMLWDLRAGEHAIKSWSLDNGLSAFDVHEQARVFVS